MSIRDVDNVTSIPHNKIQIIRGNPTAKLVAELTAVIVTQQHVHRTMLNSSKMSNDLKKSESIRALMHVCTHAEAHTPSPQPNPNSNHNPA